MRVKIRSAVQQAVAMCGAVTLCVLVFQNFAPSATSETVQGRSTKALKSLRLTKSWPDRAPRSLTGDYELSVGVESNALPDGGRREEEEEERRRVMNTVVATATTRPETRLDDIFISVKTTRSFHRTRLDLLLKTWFQLAPKQTWFFTDVVDEEYNKKTGGHLVNTNCSASHNRRALCCKMAAEFDAFLQSNKRWWCHFDDDNYVNVPQLVTTLADYDPLHDWYLGKNSIRAPLEIINRDKVSQRISFWFATGGAGFCVSRALALKMMPIAGGGKFISVGEKIRLPDDVTMGYIIEHLLKKSLTVVEEFHSHLEPMRFINTDSLARQVSFSYSQYGSEMNVLPIDGLDPRLDPTRLLSLHCQLFPHVRYCAT